jgi:hypothetical protein
MASRPAAPLANSALHADRPGTTVVNPEDKTKHLDPDMTEAQALQLARSHGADSVCLISVADCGSSFVITLSPIPWYMNEQTMMSLKVLDVPTGELLAHSDCQHHVVYPFSVIPRICPPRSSIGWNGRY